MQNYQGNFICMLEYLKYWELFQMHSIPTRIAILALLPVLMGVRCEWQGPTDHFYSLDKNGNGDVSLNEWMEYYGSEKHDHSWTFCYGNRFEPADCDNNQSLTWGEYHKNWFGRQDCNNQTIFGNLFTNPILKRPVQKETGDWSLVKVNKSDMTAYCRNATQVAVRGWSQDDFKKVVLAAEKDIDRIALEEGTFRLDCVPYQKSLNYYMRGRETALVLGLN